METRRGGVEDDANTYAAFLYCCKRNDKIACACLGSLKKRGVVLKNARDKGGNNLLHAAVSRGCSLATGLLCKWGLGTGLLNNNAKSAMALAEDYRVYGAGYRKAYEVMLKGSAEGFDDKVIKGIGISIFLHRFNAL